VIIGTGSAETSDRQGKNQWRWTPVYQQAEDYSCGELGNRSPLHIY
jgi:hypothetical protein